MPRHRLFFFALVGLLLATHPLVARIRQAEPVRSDTARINRLLKEGEVMINTESLGLAHGRLDTALQLAQGAGYNHIIGRVHFVRGFLAHREGKYEQSIQEGQQALALLQGTTEYQMQARTLCGLGSNYAVTGDMASAERYYKQSLAIAQKHQIYASVAQAYAGMSNVASSKNDFARTYAKASAGCLNSCRI